MALHVSHSENFTVLQEHCAECDRVTSVVLPRQVWEDWASAHPAPFVQDAFPMLTPSQREALFLSRICADCWDRVFSRYEEE